MLHRFTSIIVVLMVVFPLAHAEAQSGGHTLKRRDVPCQAQYSQAVQTIGMARWSAPEPERPPIERLLNAAANAKELVDSSFLQWEASLCSANTLARLQRSVEKLQSSGWLPTTAEEQRQAEAAAANAELLKAIDAGFDPPITTSSNSPSASRQTDLIRTGVPE